jgi:anti-sigma regulatory factor (Ser/Thr protein kinase)
VRQAFEAHEESVGQARRFVSVLISDLPEELRDAANLMVSELATNALVHASSGFDVDVDRTEAAVRISVTDQGSGRPERQSPNSSEPHGRGLQIVEALSDDWGTSSSAETGKTVWFQISLRRAGDHRDHSAGVTIGPDHESAGPPRAPASSPTSPPSPGLGRSGRPNARHRIRQHRPLRAPAGRR